MSQSPRSSVSSHPDSALQGRRKAWERSSPPSVSLLPHALPLRQRRELQRSVVYTPTVGEACQKYGSIFRRPQGLYISLKEKYVIWLVSLATIIIYYINSRIIIIVRGKILEVLKNWPEKTIQVIVVTDGLSKQLLNCLQCLPITIDVGTNNDQLLNDDFYIGLRQKRARGQEYEDLLHEFMCAVKQQYGEKVLIQVREHLYHNSIFIWFQFEDFANHNAFDLLAKYSKTHLVFNDDIQIQHLYFLSAVETNYYPFLTTLVFFFCNYLRRVPQSKIIVKRFGLLTQR
ncbi:hypothetical protein GW17_00016164 [Ensete ventricosum]|nr:hypothetical protein GW17_00016164 [Ensete ventricosum]